MIVYNREHIKRDSTKKRRFLSIFAIPPTITSPTNIKNKPKTVNISQR